MLVQHAGSLPTGYDARLMSPEQPSCVPPFSAATPRPSQSKPKDVGRGGVEVEAVAKQLGALSAEERQAALLADAPELLALLQDLTDSLKEVGVALRRWVWRRGVEREKA